MNAFGIYDLLDLEAAHALGVEVEDFIRTIEATTERRRQVVLEALFSDDPEVIAQCRRIFKMMRP